MQIWEIIAYLTLFRQEQLEHWVQIDEVQASTAKNGKKKIYTKRIFQLVIY